MFGLGKHNVDDELGSTIGQVRRLGLTIVFGLFTGVVIWASTVELPQAVISSGVIKTESPLHTLQHPDGGVVRNVLITEGAPVRRDEILIRLDSSALKAERDKLRRDLLAARIERMRIEADLDGRAGIDLGDRVTAEVQDLGMQTAQSLEAMRLAAIRQARRRAVLGVSSRIVGLGTTIGALEQRLQFEEDRVARAGARLDAQRGLNKRGRLSDRELEQTERAYLGLQASVAETHSELARARLDREQALLERDALPETDRIELLARMADLDRQIPDLDLRIGKLDEAIERATIRAPATGTAINLKIEAVGAVVAPHEPIVEIVPRDENFRLELRVSPTDIDRVAPGMRAQVMLSAFPQRLMPRIEGIVTRVSGDRIIAPEDGSAHFLVWLELDPESLAFADQAVPFDILLKPGMPAEAFILTGENTLLGHLLDPLRRTFERSFRDG